MWDQNSNHALASNHPRAIPEGVRPWRCHSDGTDARSHTTVRLEGRLDLREDSEGDGVARAFEPGHANRILR